MSNFRAKKQEPTERRAESMYVQKRNTIASRKVVQENQGSPKPGTAVPKAMGRVSKKEAATYLLK